MPRDRNPLSQLIWILGLALLLVGLAGSSVTPAFAAQLARPSPSSPRQEDIGQRCYAVADSIQGDNIDQTDGDAEDTLVFLDRQTGATSAVGSGIRNTGVFNIEAIAFQPTTGVLFAANEDQLGTLNLTTGEFTAKPQLFGTGQGYIDGPLEDHDFDDVDSLSFDPNTGLFYGVDRRRGAGAADLLFRIDPVTGQHVPDAFPSPVNPGERVDFVAVEIVSGLDDVDDIAIEPETGVMYAAVNQSGEGGKLVTIDRETGAVTVIDDFITSGTTTIVDDMEGLAFSVDGELFGSTGRRFGDKNSLWEIDKTTGVAVQTGDFEPPLTDFEGLGCLVVAPAIAVEKRNDANQDTIITDAEEAPGGGATVTFQVTITNTGNLDLLIQDLADDTHDISGSACAALVGTLLAVDQSVTCTFAGTIADEDNLTEVNTISVTAQAEMGPPVQASDPSTVTTPDILPSITVVKTANPIEIPQPGGPVTFDVAVTNTSPEPVTLTSLIDDIHGDLNGQGTCSVPQPLAVDGTYTCSFTASVNGNAGDSETDTVTATAEDDDGNTATAEDSATVTITPRPAPAVAVEKVLVQEGAAADGIVVVGQEMTFTIQVTNVGPTALTVVPLEDTFDTTYLEFRRAQPAPDNISSGVLVWNDLTGPDELAPEESLSVSVTFRAIASTDALVRKQTINRAIVDGASDGTATAPRVEDEAPVRITDPSVVVAKTVTDPPDGVVQLNGLVTFTIAITNIGDTRLDIVPVRDVYDPVDLEFVRTSLTTAPQVGDGELVWDDVTDELGDIPVGDSIAFTLTFRFINDAVTTSTNVAQLGEVIDEHGDFAGQPQGAADTAVVTLTPTAIVLLSFTATAGPGGVELAWTTGVEIDTFGFHLWRSEDGSLANAVRITDELIGAQGAGGTGASYQYVDTSAASGTVYRYWLEEIEVGGETAIYGPVTVQGGPGNNPSENGPAFYLPFIQS